jgi:hypothetical protein
MPGRADPSLANESSRALRGIHGGSVGVIEVEWRCPFVSFVSFVFQRLSRQVVRRWAAARWTARMISG